MMLVRACTIIGIWTILIMAPLWGAGGRYDPDYPVCMEVVDTSGGRIECHFASIEQCRQGTFGTGGTCFNNPTYVPRPAEVAPAETEPAPAPKPGKSAGRYDTDYPVCMEVVDTSGGRIECHFASIEQCRQGTFGTGGTCFNNLTYVPPPPEPASTQTEPALPAKPSKPTKPAKSAKSLPLPASPQPSQSR